MPCNLKPGLAVYGPIIVDVLSPEKPAIWLLYTHKNIDTEVAYVVKEFRKVFSPMISCTWKRLGFSKDNQNHVDYFIIMTCKIGLEKAK